MGFGIRGLGSGVWDLVFGVWNSGFGFWDSRFGVLCWVYWDWGLGFGVEKGNSESDGARPVHLMITMIKWIWTSRLSVKNSLSGMGIWASG